MIVFSIGENQINNTQKHIKKGKEKMKSTTINKQFNNSIQSTDDLFQEMDNKIKRMAISSVGLEWIGLLMHFENTVLHDRDGYNFEAAVYACSYVFDNPGLNETDPEIIEVVYSMRDEILAKANELGICNCFTPNELIEAAEAGMLNELKQIVADVTMKANT